MKKVFLTRFAPALLMAGTLAAQVVNTDQNWSSNPPLENEYWFVNGGSPNTWTVTGNIAVGNGVGPDSRLFVGLGAGGYNADGTLNLVGGSGSGDTLLLDGCHPYSPILGRLGHAGTYRGTLNILGGLAVTWGGRRLILDGGSATNFINVIKGSLDYTTAGFTFGDDGGSLLHIVGTNGAIVIAGQIYSAAGFDQWGDSKGMDAGDVRVQADAGLFLKFTVNSVSTTITATTEPQMPSGLLQNIDMTFSTNPPIGNEYHYNGGETPNTWTINGAITMGNGVDPDSRLFVGVRNDNSGNHGTLNLVGANGSGDTLLLNGYHPASPILGRLGQEYTGSWSGTLNILGGLTVTWGGRRLIIDGKSTTNRINVIKGSLDYTTVGFAFGDDGGKILHTISTNGAIVVDALIDSATGFDQWGVSKGMSAGDVLLETEPDFKMVFTQNPPNTTITAVKRIKGTMIRFF